MKEWVIKKYGKQMWEYAIYVDVSLYELLHREYKRWSGGTVYTYVLETYAERIASPILAFSTTWWTMPNG